VDPTKFVASEAGKVVRTSGSHGYHAFVPVPIPRTVAISPETVLLLSEADDALGRLAGSGRLLPNPHLLVEAYLTREALASSRIEGTQASLTEVFQAAAGGLHGSSDVEEVANYIEALKLGLARLDELPVCLRLIREIHGVLLRDVRGKEHQPGELRSTQNWIGTIGDRIDTATFVPPPPEHLDSLLADWERYANESPSVPTLIQCALLHYQFETIHPFLDGNGRLGRLLIVLFLVQRGRLPNPLLYVSRFFETHRSEYYERLQMTRERGEVQQWLQFFLTAVAEQAKDAVRRAELLLDIRERARGKLHGSRSRAVEVVDLLLGNPVITVQRVQQSLTVSNPGAMNLIRQLEGLGIISHAGRAGRGGRYFWVAHEVLEALEGTEPASATPEVVTREGSS
jgi:Fic family protein